MVNSMLFYSELIDWFWREAMLTTYYLLNRVPNKGINLPLMSFGIRKKTWTISKFEDVGGCRMTTQTQD